MDARRWEEVKNLFAAVVDLPPAQRERELEGTEQELRVEVESLLRFHGESLLDRTAAEHAVDLLRCEDVPEIVGPYRILRELGRGGMATVCLAERADGQYEKQVAVKVLRGGIYRDDVRKRFLRERQLLAGLEHSNIVRLIDGNVLEDGRPYLIEDFVCGETVTGYAKSHGLTAEERVRLMDRVVEAVAYAHGKGVVHRDLKPENILVNLEGEPKLLDFGVAKLLDGEGKGGGTETNARYWTPAYGSPEQAKGLEVGPASDVYSLGLILYEMLAGRRAVSTDGLNSYEAARAVVESHPRMDEIPVPVRGLVGRCLAKEAGRRPTARELHEELQVVDWSRRWSLPGRRAVLVTGGLAAAAVAGGWVYGRGRQPRFQKLETPPGNSGSPNVSKDGNLIAYRNENRGLRRILMHDRRDATTRELRLDVEGKAYIQPMGPKWSPDGQWIAFLSNLPSGAYGLYLVPSTGGRPRLVARDIDVVARWGADSESLYICRREKGGPLGVKRLFWREGKEETVTTPQDGAWGDLWTAVSPDGKLLAVVRYASPGDGDVYLFDSRGKLLRRLTELHCWFNGLTFLGTEPAVVFSANAGGQDRLWRAGTRAGSRAVIVETPMGLAPMFPHWSEAGLLVFANQLERVTTYRGKNDGGTMVRTMLSDSPGEAEWPAYRPHGGVIAWTGTSNGFRGLFLRDGTAVRRIGEPLPEPARELAWTPDGRQIGFTMTHNGRPTVWVMDVASEKRRPLHEGKWSEGRVSWSGDGKWVYFLSNRDGAARFYREPWPGGGEAKAVSAAAIDGFEAPGGESFLHLPNDQSPLREVFFRGGRERVVTEMPPVRKGHWLVAPGRVVYMHDFEGNDALVYAVDWKSKKAHRFFDVGEWRPALLPGLAVAPDLSEVSWVLPSRIEEVWMAEGVE